MEKLDALLAHVAIARQPILNTKQEIVAYELLYRKDTDALAAEFVDEVSATAQVIAGSLLEIGMSTLVGEHLAFINFPRAYLMNPSGVPIDRNQVVIEVLENVGYDPALLAALRKWHKAGFKIALDDFVFEPKLTPFVELATYVKVDYRAFDQDGFMAQVAALKDFDVKILAEKVENWEEFNFCKLLEVDFYQGHFFEKPEVFTKKVAKVNSITLLQLMAELLKADNVSVEELESIVSRDIGLVHKLLKYLNSPITGLVASVDSVRLAVVLVGVEQLKSLTNLLLMSEIVGERYALLEKILIRAKHAELLAIDLGYENADKYFLAGMLSMMDVCIGMELEEVLHQLPLPTEFVKAIIERNGNVGSILNKVELYGNGEDAVSDESMVEMKVSYLESIKWVDKFLSAL